MSTYEEGLLNVTGNIAVVSGTASGINANVINTTTVNATTVNPTNLGITGLQNVSMDGRLTAGTMNSIGSFTIGNQVLTGNIAGIAYSAAPYVPITNSGITSIEQMGTGIAFNNKVFDDMSGNIGGIGTYSYICASVNAFLNKDDPQAAQITNIGTTKADSSNNVNYSFDLLILYPTNPAKYSRMILNDIPSRGTSRIFNILDSNATDIYNKTAPVLTIDSSGVGRSTAGTGSGNGFIMQQGDMIIWHGWEATRPQCLSPSIVSQFPGNAVIGAGVALDASGIPASNTWPGLCMAKNLGIIPATTTTSLGMTVPSLYTDPAYTQYFSGLCQDQGYFPDTSAGIFGTPSTHNTFPLYYPVALNSQYTLTMQLTPTSTTIITIDPALYTVTNGTGAVGMVVITTSSIGNLAMAMPAQYNAAYCNINRAAIMADTATYGPAMEADASGVLRDYGCIYSLNYTGFNSKAEAIGLIATRDLLSYMRYSPSLSLFPDSSGATMKSFAAQTNRLLMHGQSMCGRFIRDFLWQGYNMSNQYLPIADGVIASLTGSRRVDLNSSFGKENGFSQSHFDHWVKGDNFPFLYETTTDAISGVTDGILAKYANYPACIPKIYQIGVGTEMYNGRESLCVTDSLGVPITSKPTNVELFYVANSGHGSNSINSTVNMSLQVAPNSLGTAMGPSAGATSFIYRSMYFHLKQWMGTPLSTPSPLIGIHPTAGILTAVQGVPGGTTFIQTGNTLQSIKPTAAQMGFPELVNFKNTTSGYGLVWNGNQVNELTYNVVPDLLNYQYPVPGPRINYAVLVPYTDASGIGNDVGGVPVPELAAPLNTFRPYNTFIPGYGYGETQSLTTVQIALGVLTAGAGDPRPTVLQLYGTSQNWLNQWNASIANLQANNLMLPTAYFGGYDRNMYTTRGQIQQYYLARAGM